MDLFYYWKDYVADIRAKRIGSLGSDIVDIERILARRPADRVWVFKTPEGKLGNLQVLGRLWVVGECPDGCTPSKLHNVFYDPSSPHSVWFTDSGTDERVNEITNILNDRYQAAFRANFRGANGIKEIDADIVAKLKNVTNGYTSVQFMDGIKPVESKKAA
ncbi:hypothetical protein AWB74_08176 [Caballeronia arvi]|uniref:Uncharacterized protein n=1 Tax=Caballeronia arvi TaxID=1777135 RepID=A0A158L2H4_9BURK|nr:hypothetical protein [Caballeronia arvi]SAL87586.1 hypothetical protein AWB74_08176 [Caballeronia arvi]